MEQTIKKHIEEFILDIENEQISHVDLNKDYITGILRIIKVLAEQVEAQSSIIEMLLDTSKKELSKVENQQSIIEKHEIVIENIIESSKDSTQATLELAKAMQRLEGKISAITKNLDQNE